MAVDAAYISEFPAFASDWLPTALRWANDRLAAHGGQITALAPGKSQFRETELADLPKSVRQVSAKTMLNEGLSSVVIACWPTDRMLDGLDMSIRSGRVKAVVVLPWGSGAEIEAWRVAHGAVDLLGKAEGPTSASIGDPVVEQAMKSVTALCNQANGMDSYNRCIVVWAFRELKKGGHRWDGQEIETWAASNGWTGRGARSVRELADGVEAGKAYRVGGRPFRPDILQIWRGDAEV